MQQPVTQKSPAGHGSSPGSPHSCFSGEQRVSMRVEPAHRTRARTASGEASSRTCETEEPARKSRSRSPTTRRAESSISTRPGSGPRSARSWTACRRPTNVLEHSLVHLRRRAHFVPRMTGRNRWRRWESNPKRSDTLTLRGHSVFPRIAVTHGPPALLLTYPAVPWNPPACPALWSLCGHTSEARFRRLVLEGVLGRPETPFRATGSPAFG